MFAFAFFAITWLLLWLLWYRAAVAVLGLEDPGARFVAGIVTVFLATFGYVALLVIVGNLQGRW